MNIKEKISEGYLHVNVVIEILGRPADFIEKTLKIVVENIGKEKGIELLDKKFFKPKAVEKLFSCFVEIELLVEGIHRLIELIFDYMPSSVEILEPQELKLKLRDANALLNDLAAKLHQYDAAVKTLKIEYSILAKKLKEKEKK